MTTNREYTVRAEIPYLGAIIGLIFAGGFIGLGLVLWMGV